MPNGFDTEDGPNPELAREYGLREHSGHYKERTGANVEESDGTIHIAGTFNTLGEKCTRNWVDKHDKPYIDVDMHNPRPVEEVIEWIRSNGIRILNVAGNVRPTTRGTKSWGIEEFAVEYLSRVFRALGHEEQVETAG